MTCRVFDVVDDHNNKPGPLAQSWLGASRVADLRDLASETGALVRETLKPLPTLPLDAIARERVLALALLAKDDAARRLLAWVERGI